MSRLRTAAAIAGAALALFAGAAAQGRDPGGVPTQGGSLSGRIELAGDSPRQPVRRAKVILTGAAGGSDLIAFTDTDGRFVFDQLAPGRYRTATEKPGFIPTQPPGAIDLAARDSRSIAVLMQRAGAIEGRFLDHVGNPIGKLLVTADRINEAGGDALSAAYWALTDDIGRFRVHTLPPGRYRVHARPPPPSSGDELYYPNTTKPAEAEIITVASGETRDGLDFAVTAAAETVAGQEARPPSAPPIAMPSGQISGRVTRADTGLPLANATAQLTSVAGAALNIRNVSRTNGNGEFEFPMLARGEYVLTVTADGYVSADASVHLPEGAGRSVVLKDGQRAGGINIALVRTSAIEGRVFDEFGDPAPGVMVQVTRSVDVAGVRRFMPLPQSLGTIGPTDDRGWFRASGLFPADYFLTALPEPFAKSTPGFALTYFPGTVSADAAQAVHIVAGMDALQANFNVVASGTITLSGVATDRDGQPAPNARIMLLPIEAGEIRTLVNAGGFAAADGTFSYRNVPAGSYVLQGFGVGMFGSAVVTVAGASRNDSRPVSLVLRGMTTVRGRFAFTGNGAAPPSPRTGASVQFRPTDLTNGPGGAIPGASRIANDWTFEISDVARRGVLTVAPPPGWVLARILFQGRDIKGQRFDFPDTDVSGLEIVLTNRVGRVAGIVVSDEQPVSGAAVVVFPAETENTEQLTQTIRGAVADANGNFALGDLLPGRYLAVAYRTSRSAPFDLSLPGFRSFATPVVVSEGATATVRLTVVK